MKHEELLEKIDDGVRWTCTGDAIPWDALRAVVELHKPKEDGYCDACFVSVVHLPYPCPTIQAIEKELY